MATTELQIDLLQPSDLSTVLRLSDQAGWNQLQNDWQRLLQLWPATCLGGRLNKQLVATATVAIYGSAGWIGMVLVEQHSRGKGIGGAILDAVIALSESHGITQLGLDATDLGRPVYLRRGFVDQVGILRWSKQGSSRGERPTTVQPLTDQDWPGLLELDRQAVGVDREPLLRHLAREAGVQVVVDRDGSMLRGFAFARPGRLATQIGPLIASDVAAGERLLDGLWFETERTLIVDAFDIPALKNWLEKAGFAVTRRLTRMTRQSSVGAVPLLSGKEVFAAVGLELG